MASTTLVPVTLPVSPPPRLLDQVRLTVLRRFNRPEPADRYVARARRYILFHQTRHPRELGALEVRQFLEHVARSQRDPVTCVEQAHGAPAGQRAPRIRSQANARRPPIIPTRVRCT